MAHITQEQLAKMLKDAENKVDVGAKYFHYNLSDNEKLETHKVLTYVAHNHPNDHYILEGLEIREESEEVSVRYKSLYGEGITWNRKLSEWLKPAEKDGVEVERFQKVESE